MRLSELKTGESAIVLKVLGHGGFRRRIVEMGFVRGAKISVVLNAPLKDPIEYSILGYNISLRRSEADMVVVITAEEAKARLLQKDAKAEVDEEAVSQMIDSRKRHINIALVGNPNSGKTSLFNLIAGAREHTGNYSGVTVGAKSGHRQYKGYEFHITDLPGTYALSPYSPEELYVRRHLTENTPDVVLNVVCASNIERNLFLTTELIDMSQNMVVALNMYDELEASGSTLDHDTLGKMMGVPMVPVVGRTGRGIEELLDTIVAVYEGTDERVRHIHINQGIMEESVVTLHGFLKEHCHLIPHHFPPRYFAIKLLEGDTEASMMIKRAAPQHYAALEKLCEKEQQHLRTDLGSEEDIESAFANQKYGFISGALRETYTPGNKNRQQNLSDKIDSIVTHRVWGYPIFILIMWAMFYYTFAVGSYPQEWIEQAVRMLATFADSILPSGALRDLIVDGIIGGVGSVIVFLPNIIILYLFISIMEDSGYLARAAFIMDKVMHKIGLHGKSFIPLVMGFGCNVPAIMASRIIESRSSRLITTMIIPFMSCSARLPIYILFIGAFFPGNEGTMLLVLYVGGILMATLTARLMRRFMFKVDETPFVMELPPYRLPTAKAVLSHMWERCSQYLRKISGMILVASIIIWFLGYFPRSHEEQNTTNQQHYENSYIGRIGHICEPVFEPLGLDWKASVSLISGIAAKEIMVSTLGVLYADDTEDDAHDLIRENITTKGGYTTASALAFIVFALLYTPCIASIVALGKENGKKWALASVIYSTTIAWLCAFAVYHLAQLIW